MKSRILDKMKFELKTGEVKLFEQKENDWKESYRGHWLQTKFSSYIHTFNSLHTGSANCS